MFVKNIKLTNFRNYKYLNTDFGRYYNIIYGQNAQGKTNILEAIFLCAAGRSHRTSKDTDLIRFGESNYKILIEIEKIDSEVSVEIKYDTKLKKKIMINEVPAKKIGNLMGNLIAVVFSPEDLLIIKEGPSERRKFIDITLSQLKPSYFYNLQQYVKILTQRNILLKDIQKRRNLIETLDIWNYNLADLGSKIIIERFNYIKRLSKISKEIHYNMTDNKENITINYCPSFNIVDYDSTVKIKEQILSRLKIIKDQEIYKGTTLIGPQRDDFEIFLNNHDIKLFGSQGQQRTAVLSLKLSELDIIRQDTGENPILLLDDVMSELDSNRQKYLFRNLNETQTFITSTEKIELDKNESKEIKYINVKEGTLVVEEYVNKLNY